MQAAAVAAGNILQISSGYSRRNKIPASGEYINSHGLESFCISEIHSKSAK